MSRESDGGFAVRAAGREHIQARIRELNDFDAHLVGVSENNQRANLSPWESALEALELRRHALASGRPHAQRDLARYLGRNVTTVNQQLAVAGAITVDLLAGWGVDARDVCRLSHEALHRIARLESWMSGRGSESCRTQNTTRHSRWHKPGRAARVPIRGWTVSR